ncbi:MAG: ThuA domain-containing protein [Flavobacteriales bacterium]|nr:ThuA domain-containing protein [Flavobacteriales bacterium]
MRLSSFLLLFLTFCTLHAQRVLHFTATSGYDHGTRTVSLAMFNSIAVDLGIEVVDDPSGTNFSDPVALAQFDAIIFSNTSGNAILNADQRANFEQWVADGGHVLGIHAASDTYRHSTANGNNTGTWDFYPELIGASVQENPNHVNGTPTYTVQRVGAHPSTYNVPDQWEKAEEYYYWENGYFAELNTATLIVEETVGPNGQVNSYDAPRPMSWYRTTGYSRIFYTALGHATENYTTDLLFRAHVRDALGWLLENSTGLRSTTTRPTLHLFPNPATNTLTLTSTSPMNGLLELLDPTGRVVLTELVNGVTHRLDLSGFAVGSYLVRVGASVRERVMVVK